MSKLVSMQSKDNQIIKVWQTTDNYRVEHTALFSKGRRFKTLFPQIFYSASGAICFATKHLQRVLVETLG